MRGPLYAALLLCARHGRTLGGASLSRELITATKAKGYCTRALVTGALAPKLTVKTKAPVVAVRRSTTRVPA